MFYADTTVDDVVTLDLDHHPRNSVIGIVDRLVQADEVEVINVDRQDHRIGTTTTETGVEDRLVRVRMLLYYS